MKIPRTSKEFQESASMNTTTVETPLALIQAQDPTFIEPLREYLVRHGCFTLVNTRTEQKITYWIIVGDSDFVKDTIARTKTRGEKALAILYEGGEDDVRLYVAQNINVALLDAKPLDEEKLRSLLLLLFTGTARSLINRKEKHLRHIPSVIPEHSRREPLKMAQENATDQARVSEIMQQIFKPSVIKEMTNTHAILKSMKMVMKMLLIVGVVSIVSYVASLVMAAVGLYAAGKFILSSNSTFAHRSIRFADSGIQTAKMFVQIAAPLGKFIAGDQMILNQERVIFLMTNVATAERSAVSIVSSGKAVITGLFNVKDIGQSRLDIADVLALRSEVVQLDQNLALVQTQLATLIDAHFIAFAIPQINTLAEKLLQKTEMIRTQLSYLDRLFTLYPQLAGYRKKQTYLVLLQNSMELRPTGGFIGSIALVTFLDGSIESIEVQDVYTADGQLKGHVDPPLPIREILGQEHWYLRDSNWDPNFTISGAQAAWFYEKEMGVVVDGVIALSSPFVTDLLTVTGPLEMPEYTDRISSTNFFAKSLQYTQTDFFPGSTQKKDFLGSLTRALLTRLTTDRSISVSKLFSVISRALDAKDIQFYVPNADVSSVLQHWGWAGGIGEVRCGDFEKDVPCTVEHVEVIEANLGVNKVNYFIDRVAESHISLSETGTITHALSYILTNKSSVQVLEGGGVYRTYVRLYYPKFSNLTAIEVDGMSVSQKALNANNIQPAPYYEISSEGDKTVVGLSLSVDPLTSKRLTVKTTRLSALSFTTKGSVQILVGKQAGIETIPWNISVQYPTSWSASSEGALAKQGELEYNTNLGKNERLFILFEKTL